MIENKKLYSEIESLIINWNNDGTKTAGYLTRQLLELLNKNKMKKEIKKVSADWIKEVGYEIIDPDGWDRTNYDYSFNKEKITMEEFNNRLIKSTVRRKFKV